MSSRLATKRLSRSRLGHRAVGERRVQPLGMRGRRSGRRRPRIVVSGVRRSWLTDDSRAARSRSRSLSCETVAISASSVDPLERKRRLVDQADQQRQLVRAHRIAAVVARDAEDAERAPAGEQRLEQPVRRGQRVRAAPGRLAVVERPVGGGHLDRVEHVLGRDRGGKRQAAVAPGSRSTAFDVEQARDSRRRASGRAPPRSSRPASGRAKPASAAFWPALRCARSACSRTRAASWLVTDRDAEQDERW